MMRMRERPISSLNNLQTNFVSFEFSTIFFTGKPHPFFDIFILFNGNILFQVGNILAYKFHYQHPPKTSSPSHSSPPTKFHSPCLSQTSFFFFLFHYIVTLVFLFFHFDAYQRSNILDVSKNNQD